MELLNAGYSFMTDGSDYGGIENRYSQDDLCGVCAPTNSLEGISEVHGAFVTQRTPLVAIVEVPKSLKLEDTDETPPIRKRILKVAPSPHHVCMAFDPSENERQRDFLGTQNWNRHAKLLHPKTRRLFDDIHGAGKFPKKKVMRPGKIPPLASFTDYTYPSGSRSARQKSPQTDEEMSATIEVEERPVVQKEWFSFPAAATAPGSMWQMMEQEPRPL